MGIDEKLLDQMEADINSELNAPRLSHVQRRALQMDRLMIMFMRQSTADHERLQKVEDASIILWAQGHPKLTVFLFSVVIIAWGLIDVREVIAKALGL
jgi:hypothetical protein